MIDIRGFFLGYRHDDDVTAMFFRWLAVAAVVGIVLLLIFIPMFRIELR